VNEESFKHSDVSIFENVKSICQCSKELKFAEGTEFRKTLTFSDEHTFFFFYHSLTSQHYDYVA
jgi:hypothetical protein